MSSSFPQGIILNEDIKLDLVFKNSIILDIVKVRSPFIVVFSSLCCILITNPNLGYRHPLGDMLRNIRFRLRLIKHSLIVRLTFVTVFTRIALLFTFHIVNVHEVNRMLNKIYVYINYYMVEMNEWRSRPEMKEIVWGPIV